MLVLVVLAVVAGTPALAQNALTLFRAVKVSENAVNKSARIEWPQVSPGGLYNLRCSSLCDRMEWCQLWCRGTSTDHCILSDMFVMPTYKEPNMDDALTCYTTRPRDLATNAAITSTPQNTEKKTNKNLVDGIFVHTNINDCYLAKEDSLKLWFLLDFGTPVTFRQITMWTQPEGNMDNVKGLRDLEVRAGNTVVTAPDGFQAYRLLGRFLGPATLYGQQVVVEAKTPVTARFLSVQRVAMDTPSTFQICHLEVY